MKILIDINHPADVHQFKHFIKLMKSKGHEFLILARNKECTHELLNSFNIQFIPRKGYSGIMKAYGMLEINLKVLKHVLKFKPDIMIGGPGDCYIAQIGWLTKTPSLIFDDTEFSKFQNKITFPFATKIITPECFWLDLGKKQVKYDGYHELAYLHPNYFTPKKSILKKYNISTTKPYVILRLVSWQATHDVNPNSMKQLKELISIIKKSANVYISSERSIPELDKYILKIDPLDLHHILYYAKLLVGESATLASEAAVLGTPAIYISNSQRGYTLEQEKKYNLVYYFEDELKAIKKVSELLKNNSLKKEWMKKRDNMLKKTVDVTKWMVDYVNKFAKSKNIK